METVHQIIDGRILSKVIDLPKSLQNIFVEIKITPVCEKATPVLTRKQLREQLHGSHTEALSGILQTDINLDESISADYIVTRNPKDFKGAKINIVTPEEFLNIIAPE